MSIDSNYFSNYIVYHSSFIKACDRQPGHCRLLCFLSLKVGIHQQKWIHTTMRLAQLSVLGIFIVYFYYCNSRISVFCYINCLLNMYWQKQYCAGPILIVEMHKTCQPTLSQNVVYKCISVWQLWWEWFSLSQFLVIYLRILSVLCFVIS